MVHKGAHRMSWVPAIGTTPVPAQAGQLPSLQHVLHGTPGYGLHTCSRLRRSSCASRLLRRPLAARSLSAALARLRRSISSWRICTAAPHKQVSRPSQQLLIHMSHER